MLGPLFYLWACLQRKRVMLLKTAKISNRSDWAREFPAHRYPLDWVTCPEASLKILVLTGKEADVVYREALVSVVDRVGNFIGTIEEDLYESATSDSHPDPSGEKTNQTTEEYLAEHHDGMLNNWIDTIIDCGIDVLPGYVTIDDNTLTLIKQAVYECYTHPTPGWALECYLGMPLMEEWQAVNPGVETEFAEYTDGMMCCISSKLGYCIGEVGKLCVS